MFNYLKLYLTSFYSLKPYKYCLNGNNLGIKYIGFFAITCALAFLLPLYLSFNKDDLKNSIKTKFEFSVDNFVEIVNLSSQIPKLSFIDNKAVSNEPSKIIEEKILVNTSDEFNQVAELKYPLSIFKDRVVVSFSNEIAVPYPYDQSAQRLFGIINQLPKLDYENGRLTSKPVIVKYKDGDLISFNKESNALIKVNQDHMMVEGESYGLNDGVEIIADKLIGDFVKYLKSKFIIYLTSLFLFMSVVVIIFNIGNYFVVHSISSLLKFNFTNQQKMSLSVLTSVASFSVFILLYILAGFSMLILLFISLGYNVYFLTKLKEQIR